MLIVKKIAFAAAAALFLRLAPCAASADSAPWVSAQCAIVMHSGGEVVYEKNADVSMLIASTTKIMTAILAIENCEIDEDVAISPEFCNVEGSSMYLVPGQSRTVGELLSGLLLASGNDAALALACHVAGDVPAFAELMNAKAAELGMRNTHYVNPHGLNADGHYSTARDLALLMDYCMDNSVFARLTAMRSCDVQGQTLINHNRLLSTCPGCIGGKTGYTALAGRCLVSCCARDGTRYVCVTLSAPDDWDDHCRLYDWAFSMYTDRDLSQGVSFEVPVVSGTKSAVTVVPEKLTVFVPTDAELVIEAEFPYFVFAPVEKGCPAGHFGAFWRNELIAEGTLVYAGDVDLRIGHD